VSAVRITHYWDGTPEISRPEIPSLHHAPDIWSLGASMYFLCLGEPPVDGLTGVRDGDEAEDITWRNNLERKAGIMLMLCPWSAGRSRIC
jgi:serine/threonine protein kinase